ncbi:hypothetical protein EGW08_017754 [Elysia chlorotica]|uniref:Uncharacterized protein n=1 Tax=Elysia chlorotica TaxID=188477 RepID=A0A433SYU7_ELYCH|nr:hypothetical protein EGW08_017754 [Elysia chlorotica]
MFTSCARGGSGISIVIWWNRNWPRPRMPAPKAHILLCLLVLVSSFQSAQTQNIFCLLLNLLASTFDCSFLGDIGCIVLAVIFDVFQCRFAQENTPLLQHINAMHLLS